MLLKIEGVSKTFGQIKALEEVSFEVDKGDFLFITGPSGAGKTTLLRLILKEISQDKGKIIFDGHDITNIPQKSIPYLRRQIGVVFQDFKIIPEMTVRENIDVALAATGVEQEKWRDRVNHVLKLVDLEERSELFPSQLSGGELQRVSLGRALVVNPKLVLADEPTGNLDWETADSIMDLFEKINQEGKTIIIATHHKLIVDRLKKRVVELKKGKVSRADGEEGKSGKEKEKKIKVKVEEVGQ